MLDKTTTQAVIEDWLFQTERLIATWEDLSGFFRGNKDVFTWAQMALNSSSTIEELRNQVENEIQQIQHRQIVQQGNLSEYDYGRLKALQSLRLAIDSNNDKFELKRFRTMYNR